jgi:hypothetical protein
MRDRTSALSVHSTHLMQKTHAGTSYMSNIWLMSLTKQWFVTHISTLMHRCDNRGTVASCVSHSVCLNTYIRGTRPKIIHSFINFIHLFIYLFHRSTLANSAIGYRTCQEPNDRQHNNTELSHIHNHQIQISYKK